MKRLVFLFGVLGVLLVLLNSRLSSQGLLASNFNADQMLAGLGRFWAPPARVENVLRNYPFERLTPGITIAEGFAAYDGNLQDTPGAAHWAIDYVHQVGDQFLRFAVYSAHEGIAFQGNSQTWGRFVVVRKRDGLEQGYNTLYSHLENIPTRIPYLNGDFSTSRGILLPAGAYLGNAGVTGNTKGIPQLHFEFHIVDSRTGATLRADPYGLYQRLGAGSYPEPGQPLDGLRHYWASSEPPFALH